jgi:hypothetical protein
MIGDREYLSLLRRCLTAAVTAAAVTLPHTAFASSMSFPAGITAGDVSVQTVNGQSHVVVPTPEYLRLRDEGQPELPYRTINILLPQGEIVDEYRFTFRSKTVIADRFDPVLAPPTVSVDGEFAPSVPLADWSGANGRVPSSVGRYLGTGYYHGHAIAGFAVFPFAIENGSLVLLEDLEVEVVTRPGEGDREVVSRERFRDGFREKIRRELSSLVVNPELAGAYRQGEVRVKKEKGGFRPTSFPSLEGSAVDYVIITNDDMASAYQTLANWKTKKGVPTVIRTVEWIEANYRNGSDPQETIRNFIKDAYAKWGITYALIGGDTEQVPVRLARSCFPSPSGYNLPTDLYYACLDGDWNADHDQFFGEMPGIYCPGSNDLVDLYAEVYVGRLPTRNSADVALLTSKIISYETPLAPDYTNKILFLAEVLFPVSWKPSDPYTSITSNGADLTEFVYLTKMNDPGLDVTRLYETDELFTGAIHEDYETTIDSLESGFDQVIHVGHGFRFNMSVGNRSVLNTDADVLTNGDRLLNLYLLNCTAVALTYFCLAEHFLLAPGGGGVSTIGAAESAYPNAASYYMNEYYELLYLEGVAHIGEAFHRSRLPRTGYALLGDNVDLWTHYIYTLLGDPEMSLWTGSVDTLGVGHASNVGLGTSWITVTVMDDGAPVDSAWVCLSKGDDDYRYGETDGFGQATFDFRAESAGAIKVVVTGLNHSRYEGRIQVDSTSAAYVSLNGMTVDDDNVGGTAGNGDGVIDAGETVDLWLETANSGTSTSGAVSMVVSTSHPDVTITDNTASVGVVSAGGTQQATDAVRMTFSVGMSDETAVAFDVTVKEGGVDTWADEFARVVHAPVLGLVTLRIDDSASGNGDGVVDANEQFALYYGLKNFGTGSAYGLAAGISDISGGFSISNGTDSYLDLAAMAEGENVGGFVLTEPNVSTEHDLEITVTDAWGRTYVDTLELRPPDPPNNLSFDSSLGSDRLSVIWDSSVSPDAARYNLYQSATQGGPYTKVNVDPVDHTVFLASGLAPSMRYYYVATAVDVSGNESALSGEFSGTTNPSQVPGWPIQMEAARHRRRRRPGDRSG